MDVQYKKQGVLDKKNDEANGVLVQIFNVLSICASDIIFSCVIGTVIERKANR